MTKPRTRIAIVLDKSGSMAATKTQAIEGLNEQIQQAKKRAKEQDIRCSFVTFDGEVYEHLWDEPADKLVEANPADFVPNGSTAWRDAVGYTVQKLLNTADTDDKDTAYLVYVISDGQTNADCHYGPNAERIAALKELIEGVQATGKWTFSYMGHDANYLAEMARQTGVPLSNMAAWSNRTGAAATRGMRAAGARLNKYLDERVGGKMQSASFNSDAGAAVAADYEAEDAVEVAAAAAPDMSEVKLGKATDLNDLMSRLPKYTNVAVNCVARNDDGTVGLFANTQGVKWEGAEVGQAQVGHAQVFNNHRGLVGMMRTPVSVSPPAAAPAGPVVRTASKLTPPKKLTLKPRGKKKK